jgi:hypothetical protein
MARSKLNMKQAGLSQEPKRKQPEAKEEAAKAKQD